MLEIDAIPRFALKDLLPVLDFEVQGQSDPQIFESGGAHWVQKTKE